MIMRWGRAALVLAGLGATLGVGLDALHVASGTTRYASPWIFGVAWWTFPLFASAAVALGLGPPAFERTWKISVEPRSRPIAIAGMALFVLAYLASCVVHGVAGAGLLVVIAAAAWWLVDRRPLAIAHAVLAAIGGFAVEATLVRCGAFVHTDGAVLGIPLWLPVLYVCG